MQTSTNIIQQRRAFTMPANTFRVLTLNGITTIAAIKSQTVSHSLARCNRLRGIDLGRVTLIEPVTGTFVDLELPSSSCANMTLIMQTDDNAYIQAASQHAFESKLQLNKTTCDQCRHAFWARRFHHCRTCSTQVCSKCTKRGNITQCSSTTHSQLDFMPKHLIRKTG